jgi:hypothetical protein
MSVITVIKKIGERVLSVVEWPFKHAITVEKLLGDALKDTPEAKTVIVGLVEQFEAIGSDTVAAVATGGANITADLKDLQDVQALFAYWQNTFLPTMEKVYADMKQDVPSTATSTESAVASTAASPATSDSSAVQTGPGLHTVSAA